MTARDYLAEVQQRADAATDGPWASVKGAFDVEVYGNEGKQYVAHTGDRGFVNAHLDAEFIAAARTDVPALVAALTAVLDNTQLPMAVTDDYSDGYNAALRDVGAAITDALTPKENDS